MIKLGLRYDYTRRKVQTPEEPPAFLDELLAKVAQFPECQVRNFKQIGINEYAVGAGIGWHPGQGLGASVARLRASVRVYSQRRRSSTVAA